MPRVDMPTLARMPASVIVAKRPPSTAADQTRQRSASSAYQSQFCASHGPSALSLRPTVVHSAIASSSVRPLSAATSSGSSPAPSANASSSAASGGCQLAVRSSTRAPKRRTSSSVRPEPRTSAGTPSRQSAARSASAAPAARPRSRGSVASVLSVASAVSASAAMPGAYAERPSGTRGVCHLDCRRPRESPCTRAANPGCSRLRTPRDPRCEPLPSDTRRVCHLAAPGR